MEVNGDLDGSDGPLTEMAAMTELILWPYERDERDGGVKGFNPHPNRTFNVPNLNPNPNPNPPEHFKARAQEMSLTAQTLSKALTLLQIV